MIRKVATWMAVWCAIAVAGFERSSVRAQPAGDDEDAVTAKHLKAIALAIHAYAEANDSMPSTVREFRRKSNSAAWFCCCPISR
jgi:hypothetical protein